MLQDFRDMLRGKKTVLFNLAAGAALIVGYVWPEADSSGLLASLQNLVDSFIELIASALVVGNLLLRIVTTTPIWRKE